MPSLLEMMAAVAPGFTLRRLRAMAAVRAYDGATTGRRGASFRRGAGGTVNSAIGMNLARLRERSHDLVRNTPFGARAITVKTSHVVGTGIRVEWDTGNDKLDQAVGTAFEDWSGDCCIEGRLDFAGHQGLAVRAMFEGGESVIRMIDIEDAPRGSVPMRLKTYEGASIDLAKSTDTARMGVELGPWERRLGLWLLPGELEALRRPESVFVRQEELCHIFHTLRPGQLHGVPILAPVMLTSRDIADVMEAVIMKAKVEACSGLFVEAADEPTIGLSGQRAAEMVEKDGQRRENLEPGMIIYGRPGEKPTPIPMSGSAAVEPISKMAARAHAVGVGVTYAQLTGDMSEANYSSLKAGAIDFHRENEVIQWHVLAPQMMNRIVRRWIDRAILAGVLRPRAAGYRYNLVMPARPPIDPLKEIMADVAEVRAGRMSPQEFIAMNGRPWRDVVKEFGAFWKATEGMTFDIDPSKVSRAGQAQQIDPAAPQ